MAATSTARTAPAAAKLATKASCSSFSVGEGDSGVVMWSPLCVDGDSL